MKLQKTVLTGERMRKQASWRGEEAIGSSMQKKTTTFSTPMSESHLFCDVGFYVPQAFVAENKGGFELLIFLPSLSQSWDYRCTSLH